MIQAREIGPLDGDPFAWLTNRPTPVSEGQFQVTDKWDRPWNILIRIYDGRDFKVGTTNHQYTSEVLASPADWIDKKEINDVKAIAAFGCGSSQSHVADPLRLVTDAMGMPIEHFKDLVFETKHGLDSGI